MKIKFAPFFLPLSVLPFQVTASTETVRLEEVQVTAQKRSQNVYKVPIAIDVIDNKTIDNLAVTSLSQLENASPSMNFGRAGRKARGEITIRGVGDFSRNIGTDARVAVYIDDVPLGRSSAYDVSLIDLERVEILRGPQGTLFGTNSIAGAINIITPRPSDEFDVVIDAGAGNLGQQRFSVKSNMPFSSILRSSVVIARSESDGFIENINLGETLQGSEMDSARLKIDFSPNEGFTLGLDFDWLEDKALSTNGQALSSADRFGGFAAAPDPRQVAHDTNEFEQRKISGASLHAKWRIRYGLLLESISAKRQSEFKDLSEEDYSPLPISDSRFDEQFDQVSQEFRLISSEDTRLSYVIGAFYSAQKTSTVRGARLLNGASMSYSRVATPGELDHDSIALFANISAKVSKVFSFDLGLRAQDEKKRLDYAVIDTTGFFENGEVKEEQKFSSVLPRLGFNFSFDDNALVYYSVARGAKSGGWNADFVSSLADLSFDTENATSFEIGYKTLALENKLSLSLAAFTTRFKDFQVFQFVTKNGSTLIDITNAGEATSQGIELDSTLYVSDTLSFTIKAATVQAKFDSFDDATPDGESFAGNSLPYSPEINLYAALNYSKDIFADLKFTGNFGYTYSDEYFTNPNNEALYRVDSFFETNTSVSLSYHDKWEISIWGKNLNDNTYLKYRDVSFLGIQRGYYAPPRSYGLDLTARF